LFSYRHGFHAGNHADVLKHVVLVQLAAYLEQVRGINRVTYDISSKPPATIEWE